MQKIDEKHSYIQYMPYTSVQFSEQELLTTCKNTFRPEFLPSNLAICYVNFSEKTFFLKTFSEKILKVLRILVI